MESFGQVLLAALSWVLLVLGYIFTIGLLYVPAIRLRALWTAEDGVDHTPVLYILSLANALTWFAYGYLDPRSTAVMLINLIAVIVYIIYTIWYTCICKLGSEKIVTIFFLTVVLLVCGALAGIHTLFPDAMGGGSRDSLNVPVMITSTLMYISPLPDMVTAIWTRDAGRMSFPVVLASLGNAFFWGKYGRLEGQIIVQKTNEWGIYSPMVQVVVYLVLRRNELSQIWFEEIPQFFHWIPQFFHQIPQSLKNGYDYLRRDEEESDDD